MATSWLNLDAEAAAGHWKDVLPKPILDASLRDGHLYALPVNIHGQNWLFYNTKVFADAGVAEPKTWSDVITAGKALRAKGLIALAHGGQSWQDHRLFDAVLAGEGGSDLYLRIIRERCSGRDRRPDVHACRGDLRATPRADGPGHAGAQLERRDQSW